MSGHTPGPWTVDQRAGNSLSIDGPEGREIASVYDEDIDDVTPQQEADARLMAAAPDLLDACDRALGLIAAVVKHQRVSEKEVRAMAVILSGTLTKARGAGAP